jgi:hypothetical protein
LFLGQHGFLAFFAAWADFLVSESYHNNQSPPRGAERPQRRWFKPFKKFKSLKSIPDYPQRLERLERMEQIERCAQRGLSWSPS